MWVYTVYIQLGLFPKNVTNPLGILRSLNSGLELTAKLH